MAVRSETLLSLRDAVRSISSEPDITGHVDNTEIDRWLNMGLLEAIKVVGKLYVEQTITTVASQADYALPDNFQNVINVQQQGSINRFLDPMPSNQYLTYSIIPTNSLPTHYVIIGEKIYIYQTPSTAGISISHWYEAYTDELSDDTDIPYNGIKRYYPYHANLIDYAVARLKQKENAQQEYLSYMTSWQQSLAIMKRDMARRNKGIRFRRYDDQTTRIQQPYIPLHV